MIFPGTLRRSGSPTTVRVSNWNMPTARPDESSSTGENTPRSRCIGRVPASSGSDRNVSNCATESSSSDPSSAAK